MIWKMVSSNVKYMRFVVNGVKHGITHSFLPLNKLTVAEYLCRTRFSHIPDIRLL